MQQAAAGRVLWYLSWDGERTASSYGMESAGFPNISPSALCPTTENPTEIGELIAVRGSFHSCPSHGARDQRVASSSVGATERGACQVLLRGHLGLVAGIHPHTL